MVLAIALIIFLLGVSAGARFNRERRANYLGQGSALQCGATGGVCPMMRGNRGFRGENLDVEGGAVQVQDDRNAQGTPTPAAGNAPTPAATSTQK